LRRAVRLRMEREQQAGNTLDAVDARMNRLEQEVWWLVAGPSWQSGGRLSGRGRRNVSDTLSMRAFLS
jgi:hypothetical protein